MSKITKKDWGVSVLACGVAACLATTAVADEGEDGHGDEEHYDIGAYNDNGKVTIGGWDHDTESLEVANLRLFEAHFGEDPDFPNAIDEPGVGGAAADMGFDLGSTLRMNMLSGARVWNGSGFVATSTLMSVDYGPGSMNSNGGGFLDFSVTEDYDLHPIFSIDSAAASGSYLLEFTMAMDGLQTSDSFWIVFNFGMDDEDFEATVEWAESNIVPVPGVLAIFTVAGASLAGRRRRNG